MANQYPIWNEIHTDSYKGKKSFGSREGFKVDVKVGTSKTHSNHFSTIEVTNDNGTFSLYVDGKIIKTGQVDGNHNYSELLNFIK